MRISYKVVTVFVLSFWISFVSFAQNNTQGTLKGVVTDPSGGRIPGATIQLKGPSGEQTQTSNEKGEYTFTNVKPGAYDVQVSVPDFKTERRQGVNVSGSTSVDVQLSLESQTQVVTVEEQASTVSLDPDSNASATVLDKKELEGLSDDPDELAQQLQALAVRESVLEPEVRSTRMDSATGQSRPRHRFAKFVSIRTRTLPNTILPATIASKF
jgi:hypothetical protein